MLLQACLAYRNDGGRVMVVMSQRSKLEMEASFRRNLPEDQRHKSQFVFRQGSPLVPDDLRNVGANDAAVVVIVADASRHATALLISITNPPSETTTCT